MRRKNKINNNTKNNKVKVGRLILACAIGVLAVSSVFLTIESATSGVEVSSLRQKEAELSMEKRNLEGTLVKSLSVNSLEKVSGSMGYTKPANIVYVSSSQETVAKLP